MSRFGTLQVFLSLSEDMAFKTKCVRAVDLVELMHLRILALDSQHLTFPYKRGVGK